MRFLSEIKIPRLYIFLIAVVILYSVFVRLQGLGYSNFQGDEVNPMDFMYEMNNGVFSYLLDQKRGSIQYLINMANVGIFGYHNEFQIRFPFFVFGSLAILTLYKLSKKIFNSTSAFFTAVLVAVNGLFIAFARITQYQSVIYFLIPVGVLLFINAIDKNDNKKLAVSGLIMSLALLAHYDTLSVAPFFIVVFASRYFRDFIEISRGKSRLLKELAKKLLIFWGAFLIPALVYYIPFYFHTAFSDTTSVYLGNRLLGGGLMPRTEITKMLLSMYIPQFFIYLLFALGFAALFFEWKKTGEFITKKLVWIVKNLHLQYLYAAAVLLIPAVSIFSLYPIKPRLSSVTVILLSIFITFVLAASKKVDKYLAGLAGWFLGSYSFYFFIMKDPRTHVYVVFIPLFILAGYGFFRLYSAISAVKLRNVLLILFSVVLLYISGLNWVIFVDKSPEYPWWDKDYLGQPIYRIGRARHKKIEGVFGFNSYRAWDQLADLYKRGCITGDFNSNEKDSITYFYVRQHQKQGGQWGLFADSDNLAIAESPHSWEYDVIKDQYPGYKLLDTIKSNGYTVLRVFGRENLYPEGKLLCN